ncbi:CRACD-like protein isoform X1 [Cebus imitator]|uniref:CRACD-like protein isoform X1 n=2 Tax=Cebus imitator TaxID=2715852 RepID=UPI001897EF8A|nr:CRACD-like protein isoform X1 [Cebus imitator]
MGASVGDGDKSSRSATSGDQQPVGPRPLRQQGGPLFSLLLASRRMREPEAHSTLRRMAAFYQCIRPDPRELDMISTRVMDIKLREAAEGLGEDSTGKKKSKFKTFKKFFGKKKRKESPSSTGSSTWKQSQTRNEVIAIESGPVGYDSEDELEESRGTMGSRALSHDSIFIPESGQDPTRPVRVFSQENVCDRIKALQLKIQCNVKMGPPPPPGGLPAKRGEDAGMSSEDDGLPRSPPEMSLLHDVGPGTTIKVSVVSPDHVSNSTVSARTSDSSLAPVADFSYPPESSSCLDNSAAKHKLQVKPRNQRSSKMRRLSSRAQSESLSDLTYTPEEEENEEKPLLEVSPEESPSSGQQDVARDRGPEPGPPAPLLPNGGTRARRARLQHCQALRASVEEEGTLGEDPSSRLATPELAELQSTPALRVEPPSPPADPQHLGPDGGKQEEGAAPAGPCAPATDTAEEVVCAPEDIRSPSPTAIPKGDPTPPETVSAAASEAHSAPDDQPDHSVLQEAEPTPPVLPDEEKGPPGPVPEPERAGAEPERAGTEPERAGTELARAGIEPERAGNEPERAGSEPERAGNEPERAGNEPERAGNQPERMGTEPERAGTEPERAGTEPERAGAEPETAGTEPETAGTEPERAGTEPERAGNKPARAGNGPERAETEPERAGNEPRRLGNGPSAGPAPSTPVPKSCLKHRPAAAIEGPAASPPPAATKSPPGEPGPSSPDAEAAAPERPKAERAEAPPAGAERAAPERKAERGGAELRGAKKFSVSSCRARPRPGASRPLERAGGRLPLSSSRPAWRSEAALDDLQGLPEPQHAKAGPRKPAECGPQDSGDRAATPAGPRRSPQEAAASPGTREPCPAAKEPAPSEDRNPFPVKLRSTSLSLKYRDGASQEAKGVKRYGAEVRLERSLTVLPKEEKCPLGTAPALRGARAPSDQGKGKARPPEPLSSKPPLPRKPLLQSFTLPPAPAPPDTSPGERDPRKEPRTAEKRPLRRGAEKNLLPAATGPGADGQPAPPWITVTRQKRRGALDQPTNQEDKPGARTAKSELGKQAKVHERAQEPVKQADFVRSKSFLITPVKPAVDRKQGAKLNLKEGLQRGISLSHQNLAAQSAVMTEKELHQLKRASYASTDQPSWMELARKKSQAWSDMPQIIK